MVVRNKNTMRHSRPDWFWLRYDQIMGSKEVTAKTSATLNAKILHTCPVRGSM